MLTYKKITANMEDDIQCGEFTFVRNFDSGNLGVVEQVNAETIALGADFKSNSSDAPDYEFNIMTRPDCIGTEFENGNRTWFYFGIRNAPPSVWVKLNLVNLNRQGKMYSQGMAPVTKTVPGKPHWERIKDKPVYYSDDNIFTLSFKFTTPANASATTYFAFTYPYTYVELQNMLKTVEMKIEKSKQGNIDDIYYYRECVCHSLEKRRVDLITITSQHGMTNQREDKLKNLFPEGIDRPFKFSNKKIIFISARVHPGETPSSFVFNGFLNLLVNRNDPVAIALRRLYVFKMIPFMNPDGVAKGHYRTDTRGVNLNRVYQVPSIEHHPSVYAARALIRYHHFGFEKYDNTYDTNETNQNTKPFEISSANKKKFTRLDQENVSSNELNMKNKNSSNLKFRQRWINPVEPKYQSLNLLKSSSTSRIPKMKLAIDSEDDTSCSISTNNITLADQVEELNLNQSSVDGFNIIPSDNECAVDIDINQSSGFSNDTSADISNATYDDNDDVIVPIIRISKNIKSELIEAKCDKPTGSLTMSTYLRLSQSWCKVCKMEVKDLESKMPGISQMLPSICKKEDIINKNEVQSKTIFCVNCHSQIDVEPQNRPDRISIINNNANDVASYNSNPESSNATAFHRDLNKNKVKNKEGNNKTTRRRTKSFSLYGRSIQKEKESDLFLYIDLHGHASKKGIFMYGNHFEDIDNSIECMLLPRIMSLNNMHFHFTSCNFTERNMYLKDRRDGMSREGSGRVAVLKATGLMRSYTLECNYNTGRLVNILPPTVKESLTGPLPSTISSTPPKYTPHLFEEVGKSLGSSILDLTGNHPNSRIPASEHRSLHGIREWLRVHSRQLKPAQIIGSRQAASACTVRTITPRPVRSHMRAKQQVFVDPERKENLATAGFQTESRIASSRIGISSTSRTVPSPKLIPMRLRGEQPLSAKPQRNLSLISIKKPAISKHPPTFKTPLRNKSPGPKIRYNSKQKIVEEPELIKGAMRGLTDSNRSNTSKQSFKNKVLKTSFKCHKEGPAQKPNAEASTTATATTSALAHRKSKIRSKDGVYQKQPGQFTSKPLIKRLKVSQCIKYSDNAKEKYRIRKPTSDKSVEDVEVVSSSVSSSGEEMVLTWDGASVAGSSGISSNTQSTAKSSQKKFKSRRTALHCLPSSTTDLGNIRSEFV